MPHQQKKLIRKFSKKALQQKELPFNTSLVVLGTNLGSTVGSGRLTKQVREMISFPPYQKSIIVGLILSDG